jgi:hypothetical protein
MEMTALDNLFFLGCFMSILMITLCVIDVVVNFMVSFIQGIRKKIWQKEEEKPQNHLI